MYRRCRLELRRRDILNREPFVVNHEPSNTAILIFSRSAREEARTKQFGRHLSAAQNLQVAQHLIRRTRRMARRTRLPVFVVSGGQQYGGTFGERLTNAFSAIFEQGFQYVISIGTDCPALKPQVLLNAARDLKRGKIVAGSDHTGGLYYLGLSHRQFDQKALAALPWQSGYDFAAIRIFAQLRGYDLRAGCVMPDVDNANDLWRVLQELPRHSVLVRSIWSLLQATCPIQPRHLFVQTIPRHFVPELRGPPRWQKAFLAH